MSLRIVFLTVLLLHCVLLLPFSAQLRNRPIAIKLGYLPHSQILKPLAGDQKLLMAEAAVVKVLFYYGTWIQKLRENVIFTPELGNMYRTLVTASQLDPYNQDIYYFSQAAFTWEVGRVKEVNELLEYGMKYRTWDPWLPFYAGFNYSYFLKDNARAAHFFEMAAQKSANPLFAGLAARYYYESDQTPLALAFLETMIRQAKDPSVRRTYELRRQALFAVMILQQATDEYRRRFGELPESLRQLIEAGLIEEIPIDPYGGEFYLDESGRVRTTSKLASLQTKE